MRAVVQRVLEASVTVSGNKIAAIGSGLLVLLGVEKQDTMEDLDYIVKKIAGMRIFEDENGKTNLDLKAVNGELLLISQFTLCADLRHGKRPDFFNAAPGEQAKAFYEACRDRLQQSFPVQTGVFGADMKVMLVNDGPFTVLLDSGRKY